MKPGSILVFFMFLHSSFASTGDNDVHPRCPFKYYKNVDRQSLCLAYDNEMGECQGESQLDCSNDAFEKTLQKYSVKKQEINFDEIGNTFEEEKIVNEAQFESCKFADSDKRIVCKDGRIYILRDSQINDNSRGIIKEIEKSRSPYFHSDKDRNTIKK